MRDKMMVYNMRDFDELAYFKKYSEEYGIDIVSCPEKPDMNNACLAQGCRFINVITTPVDSQLLAEFRKTGAEYIVTRTIGYDHIDLSAAKKLGISAANTPYSPDGVAEYTLMLMLNAVRNFSLISRRFEISDFSLRRELMGKELSDMTVGIVGTGRIGSRLAQLLSGFGCRVIACSPRQNATASFYAEYVSFDTLCREADIISLHAPANEESFHMIDSDSIAKMRDGVILINNARGSLIDTSALIDGLKSGKISGAALDVLENDSALFYHDLSSKVIGNADLDFLRSCPNVILSHHMAFYTQQAVETMVRDSLKSAYLFAKGEENPWLIRI